MVTTRSKSSHNQGNDLGQTLRTSDFADMEGITPPGSASVTPVPETHSQLTPTSCARATLIAPAPSPAPILQQEQQQQQGEGSSDITSTSPYGNRFIQEIKDGYIEHKEIGLVMHPSFYNDEECGFSLCTNIRSCRHDIDCYEIRKRMAVFACIRGLTYREASYIWGVSKSTLQREVVENGNRILLKYLLTPRK